MAKKKSMIMGLTATMLAMALASCGGGSQPQPSSQSAQQTSQETSQQTSQQTSQSASQSASQQTSQQSASQSQSAQSSATGLSSSSESKSRDESYETWTKSWSKANHLYIHYLRPEAESTEYNKYCVWLWQHKPQDLEGGLWGFGGNPQVSSRLTLKPMSTAWMQPSEVSKSGTGNYIDDYGAIMDIDLGKDGLVGGKSGKPITYEGATELGFLMVDESSMDGSTNWTSDGGKETYIKDFDTHFRDDGSMHVYIVSGDFKNYQFEATTTKIRVNPVTKDQSGDYRSKTQNISSDKSVAFDPAPTSTADDFKSLGVGYQIFVASFADSDGDGMGDLRGIINKLDYLEDLGAQVLWLTPIQQSDSYHGYDISDYFAVDSKFGTEDDYRELIYKAHQKGMKVLMDLVLNHTSKNNVWFEKSQWAVNSPGAETDETGIEWRNVYSWKFKTDKIQKFIDGRYQEITVLEDALSDNPSWYRDGESDYYYYGKFGSGMPEINYEYQPTRDLIKDMARYWLSFGLDGYRLDAVKHIYMKDEVASTGSDIIITDTGTKNSYDDEKGKYVAKDFDYSSDLNKNVVWWREFANNLKSAYPNCFLVGENFDGWGNRMSPYYQAMDSQFDFANYYHSAQMLYSDADHYDGNGAGTYAAKHPGETYSVYGADFTYNQEGNVWQGGKRRDFINGAYTSNHDVDRAINKANGTWAKVGGVDESVPASKITGTAQEVGRAKIMGAMAILQPGVSWIYYGDELGMSGNTDKHVEIYGNENSMDIWYRQPMKWGKAKTDETTGYKAGQYTFEWDSYNLNLDGVAEQKAKNDSMYSWYKSLNAIKKMYPKGATISFDAGDDILICTIKDSNGAEKLKLYINVGRKQKGNDAYMLNPGSGWNLVNNDAAKILANQKSVAEFGSNSYSVYVYSK